MMIEQDIRNYCMFCTCYCSLALKSNFPFLAVRVVWVTKLRSPYWGLTQFFLNYINDYVTRYTGFQHIM